MTRCLLSVAMLLTPAPMNAPKEAVWQPIQSSSASASPAADISTTEYWSFPSPTSLPESPNISSIAESAPPISTVPILSPIDTGLNRLNELGASPYQLRVFGCLAWFESKNDPYVVSRTQDYGLWQINRYFHAWRWAGRDIFDPITNAEVAWDIYRESGFRAWTTARLCV